MIYLNVPFNEKEQAKKRGARWDSIAKKWYIPENLIEQKNNFERWFTDKSKPSTNSNLTENPPLGLTLSALLNQIKQHFDQHFFQMVWVKAEIAQLNERRGHYYFELTDPEQQEGQCRATLWRHHAQSILKEFETITGAPLAAGQTILILVQVQFHQVFGFSLSIQSIDASFTLGAIEQQLNQIRQRLINENLYEHNKRFSFASDFSRLAIIAPPKAAGLGDFQSDAQSLQTLGLCEFCYFFASFQGEQAEKEIQQAYQAMLQQHQQNPFDAVILLRGGGAKLDLHWLNNYFLAKIIAQSPLAVYTALGHERDHTLLDEVAAVRFDTPSKAIAAVRQQIILQAQQAMKHWQLVQQISQQKVAQHQQIIKSYLQQIQYQVQQKLLVKQQQVENLQKSVQQQVKQTLLQQRLALNIQQAKLKQPFHLYLAQYRQSLEQSYQACHYSARKQLETQRKQIQQNMRLILSAGPQTQLNRGFSLVRNRAGELIKSKSIAQQQDQLTLSFYDGEVEVTVDQSIKSEKENDL